MSSDCPPGHYNQHGTCKVCSENLINPNRYGSCQACSSPLIPNIQRTLCIKVGACTNVGGQTVGYPNDDPDWEQCLCPVGQGPNGADGQCDRCPNGWYSNQSEQYVKTHIGCTECSNGKIANVAQTDCQNPIDCTNGIPNSEVFQNQCYCRGGYSLNTGKTTCQPCEASWYSPRGSNVCAKCPENKVSAAGSHSCTTCAQNAEYPNEARSACLCAGGYGSSDGNSCTQCPAGTYHTEDPHEHGKVSCQNCQAGYFSHAGETACRACPAGTMSKERSGQCTKCPEGSISTEPGSPECRKCDSKTQVPNENQTACLCIAGYYMSGSFCVACPENQISLQGSISCTPCKPGEASNKERTQCVPVDVQDQSQEQNQQQAQGPPVGIIAGVVAGVLIAVAAVTITVVVIKRKKNRLVASAPKTRGRQVVASTTRRTRHVSLIGSDFMPAQ